MDPSALSLLILLVGLLQAVVVSGISHGRPPPYAVPMEPLVQYSARDPLYHNPISRSGDVGPDAYPYYIREPEPIIEIIVKESNVTLPPPPPVTLPPPTKEPVHVFYVKYKKDPTSKGGVAYDAPVPAITPPSAPVKHVTQPPIYTAPPQPDWPQATTTLRTIIRPDSETSHGSGLRVTFGSPHSVESEDRSEEHASPEQESAPEPALIPPPTPRPQRQTFPNSRPFETSRPKFQPQGFQPLQQPQHLNNFQPSQQHFQQFHPPQTNTKTHFPSPQRAPQPQNQQFAQHFQGPRAPVQPQQNKQSLLNPQQQAQYQQQFNQHQQQLQQFKQHPFPRQQPQVQPPLNQPQSNHQHQQFNHQIQQQHQFRQPAPQPQFVNNFQQPQQLHQPQQIHHQPQQIHHQPQQLHHQPQQIHQQQPLGPQTHFPQVQQQQSPQIKGELIKSVTHFEEHLVQTSKDGKPFGNNGFFQQQQNLQASSPSGIQQNIQQQHFQQNVKHAQQQQQQKINQFQQPVSNPQTSQPHIQNIQQQPFRQFEPQQQQQQPSHAFQQQQKPVSSFQQQQTGHGFQQHQQQQTGNAFQQQQQKPVSSFQQQQTGSTFQQQSSQQLQQQSRHTNNEAVSQPQVQLNTQHLLAQQRIVSTTTSTTPATVSSSSPSTPESENKKKTAIASLPDEVPSDLREQLLSSGILSNADIQVLDYDKVGDIPIESLPPEALENFYGAGSAPVPSVIKPENVSMGNNSSPVEMKVVRFDSSTPEGRRVAESYIPEGDTATLDTVLLGGAGYSRYLPLTVGGAHFPVPEELKGRNITSVVVLAPVDYKFEPRSGRAESEAEVDGVRFVGGEALSNVLASPSPENIATWLKQEKDTAPAQQSIILLVAAPKNGTDGKEIFMYDIATQRTSKLQGELSATFVRVAEENAGVEAPTSQ